MGRWLGVLLWGVVAIAGAARAGDTPSRGPIGVLHFTPPAGYCLVEPGAAFNTLKQGPEDLITGLTVRQVFASCQALRLSPPRFDEFGFLATVADGPGDQKAADENRQRWLKALADSRPKDPAVSGSADSLSNAALVLRRLAPRRDGIELGLDAVTMIDNTRVVIGLRSQTRAGDLNAVATGFDRLRPTMRDTLARFAKDNAFSIEDAPDTEQAYSAGTLGVAILCALLGGILLIALMVRRTRAQIPLAALLVAAGTLFGEAAPGARPITRVVLGDAALFAALGVVWLFLTKGFLYALSKIRVGGAGLTEQLRRSLSSQAWYGAQDAVLDTEDLTKRWFVAVAAATGSVVFALVPQRDFLAQLAHAVAPTRIIFTFLIAVVSLTLIGPVEEFIFESRLAASAGSPPHGEREGEESRFQRLVELMSPRAIGRFALVLAFMMVLAAVHSALETRLHEGSGVESFVMVFAGLGPGIISYLWCGALQRGVPSVAGRTGLAAGVAGVLLFGLPLALFIGMGAILMPSRWYYVAYAPVGPLGTFFGFGGLAFAGGLAIDYSRR